MDSDHILDTLVKNIPTGHSTDGIHLRQRSGPRPIMLERCKIYCLDNWFILSVLLAKRERAVARVHRRFTSLSQHGKSVSSDMPVGVRLLPMFRAARYIMHQTDDSRLEDVLLSGLSVDSGQALWNMAHHGGMYEFPGEAAFDWVSMSAMWRKYSDRRRRGAVLSSSSSSAGERGVFNAAKLFKATCTLHLLCAAIIRSLRPLHKVLRFGTCIRSTIATAAAVFGICRKWTILMSTTN